MTTTDYKKLLASWIQQSLSHLPTHPHSPQHQDPNKYNILSGIGGLAYIMFRIHERDPGFAANFSGKTNMSAEFIARDLIEKAVTKAHHQEDPTVTSPGTSSCDFLTHSTGVYALASRIFHHFGDEDDYVTYLERVQHQFKTAFVPRLPFSLVGGRAGMLYSLEFMPFFKEKTGLVQSLCETILEGGGKEDNQQEGETTILQWDDKRVSGWDGQASILTILIQHYQKHSRNEPLPREIMATLEHDYTLRNANLRGAYPVYDNADVAGTLTYPDLHGELEECLSGLTDMAILGMAYHKANNSWIEKSNETAQDIWNVLGQHVRPSLQHAYEQVRGDKSKLRELDSLVLGLRGLPTLAYLFLELNEFERGKETLDLVVEYLNETQGGDEQVLLDRLENGRLLLMLHLLLDVAFWKDEVFVGMPFIGDIWRNPRMIVGEE